jgi:hypothetical protein
MRCMQLKLHGLGWPVVTERSSRKGTACDVLIERQHTASLWSVTQLPPAPCASAPCMHIATCVVPLAALRGPRLQPSGDGEAERTGLDEDGVPSPVAASSR